MANEVIEPECQNLPVKLQVRKSEDQTAATRPKRDCYHLNLLSPVGEWPIQAILHPHRSMSLKAMCQQ